MKNKLAAFTMIELIVVMVLSGIIFSMALLVVDIMQQQATHQERQHQEVLEIEALQLLLKRDAYNSTIIWTDPNRLLFEYDAYRVSYQVNDKMIGRTLLGRAVPHTDTFWLPNTRLTTRWQQQAIKLGVVDALTVESQFFGQPYTISIQKQYDSKILLETVLEQPR